MGDQLIEENDDFNDDTFGGGGESSEKAASKDFDFFGNTSKVSDAINEEGARFTRRLPSSKPLTAPSGLKSSKKPFKTGYESYKDPIQIANLQADPSLWGTAPAAPPVMHQSQSLSNAMPSQAMPTAVSSKKMMSLEEIEAIMFSQPKPATLGSAMTQQIPAPTPNRGQQAFASSQSHLLSSAQGSTMAGGRLTTPVGQAGLQASRQPQKAQAELPAHSSPAQSMPSAYAPPAPHILHRPSEPQAQFADTTNTLQPRQILQNPHRQLAQSGQRASDPQMPLFPQPRMMMTSQGGSLPIITHPSQLRDLTDEQRHAVMIEEAKRAKRNHKIALLSKDNGLMTPQDKNFITRIQLQQLMTATGSVNEQDPDAVLSEDFYYQVFNQIENRPRQNPHQPLSNFAQTYLLQTGNRQGAMGRRMNRGGDTHVHRMQQQVQRAVEAAKLKPKGKQLVIEGSLGKISFSNAKTPKPLLNIKRNDNKVPQVTLSSTDRKAILKNIEAVYTTLMKMEDHDRRQPPPSADENGSAVSESLVEWRKAFQDLNQKLWNDLKVMEPIIPESTVLHPFIAFLSYPKGKKAIPRIFSQLDSEQRLTILTIIMVQLDTLDVIRYNLLQFSSSQSPSVAREQIDLFLHTVMPTLFSYVTKAPLSIVMGLIGLLLDRVNVQAIIHTRVGLEILTMLLSQAEIIRKAEATNEQEWDQWLGIYNRLFDTVEPALADIFPGSVSAGQDVYVWQFLATVGTGASPEQQQRLVLAMKYVT